MANTFKVITKAGVTSADVIYTVASSTTTVVLGMMVGNTTTGQITATVTLTSDTSNRAGANNEVVMETTDTLTLTATGAADIALSVMEIT
jgi:hypothetical protein